MQRVYKYLLLLIVTVLFTGCTYGVKLDPSLSVVYKNKIFNKSNAMVVYNISDVKLNENIIVDMDTSKSSFRPYEDTETILLHMLNRNLKKHFM